MGYPAGKGKLYCPSARYWGSPYSRAHFWNLDFTGGPTWGDNPDAGPYGVEADPKLVTKFYSPFIYGALGKYYLGARVEMFRRPATQYLMLETEAGNDVFGAMTGAIQFGVPPLWLGKPAGGGYGFAYRHVLPRDPALYRTQATGTFLYMDAHVEIRNAPGTVNTVDRFVISE